MIVEETREPVYGQEVKTAGLFVLLGGLITTALACWVVYLGNTGGNSTGLLGVYILFIVPISAIIAGFAAGAGYSILSWLTGVRVSSRLLVVVFVLTLLSYFAIQYCEYRKMQPRRAGSNETVSFPAYFDAITRSYSYHLDAGISSRSETTNKRSKPVTGIGVLGYGFRMLEIIGYSLGGIVPLLLLRTKPYCARCQRYREYHKVITFPALHLSSTTSKKEIEAFGAYELTSSGAVDTAKQDLGQLIRLAIKGDLDAFLDHVNQLHKQVDLLRKRKHRYVPRYWVRLNCCPGCSAGKLVIFLRQVVDHNWKTTELSRHKVSSGLIRGVLQR